MQIKDSSLTASKLANLNGISDAVISRTDSSVAATVLSTDQLVRLNATGAGASQTATLPAIPSVFDGKIVSVLGSGTSTYPATVVADGSDTFLTTPPTINEDGMVINLVANLVTSQWEILSIYQPSAGGGPAVAQTNYNAVVAPVATDDDGAGYSAGSVWIDTVGNEAYRCLAASTGAAIWVKTTLSSDELPSNRSVQEYNSASGNLTLAATVKTLVLTMAGTDDVAVTVNPAAQYPDSVRIKRLGSGTGSITIIPNGTENIDGETGTLDTSSTLSSSGDLIELEPYSTGFLLA